MERRPEKGKKISEQCHTDFEAARRIEPVEEVVDDLVATMKNNRINRLRDGKCTAQAGLVFEDVLVNVERIADQCSSIGVFTMSLTNERAQTSHCSGSACSTSRLN